MKRWNAPILATLALLASSTALAGDFLLTASRPNTLHLIDLEARKLVRSYDLPGDGVPSAVIVPSDGKRAYVLTNRAESIVGIDLDSGQQVFRADMSKADERVKSMFGVTVSRDGSTLYAYQIPTRLKRSSYESLDTRIAVYNTADGLKAQPVKTFPAPRRITLLAPTANKDRVVGVGEDIYVFDARTGKIDQTHALRHWQRPGVGEPDILTIWHQYEQAGVLASPYYVARTDVPAGSPESFKIGLLRFDLDAEKLDYAELANAETGIFSAVVSPVDKDQVFTVMNQIFHADMKAKKFVQRLNLDQSYYAINISSDGKEIYIGGALDKVSVYDTATLTKQAEIRIPGGFDQSTSSMRIVHR